MIVKKVSLHGKEILSQNKRTSRHKRAVQAANDVRLTSISPTTQNHIQNSFETFGYYQVFKTGVSYPLIFVIKINHRFRLLVK